MRPLAVPLFALMAVTACSSSTSNNEMPVLDVAADLVFEEDAGLESPDLSDLSTPPPTKPKLLGAYAPFMSLPEGPAIQLKMGGTSVGGQVSFNVYAAALGKVAGVAFYVEYDPELMEFKEAVPTVNLGSSIGVSTKTVVKMLEPGLLTFGAARFCETKIPWGPFDQCGGHDLEEATSLVALYFQMKRDGEAPLRFPERKRLIRRPDHSMVKAAWIGGAFRISPKSEVAP
jgi:hypothetical protein